MCWVAPGKKECWAVTSTDLAPMLIALDARVHLVGSDGERTIAVEDLYRNDGMAHLTKAPDEIITEVAVPPQGGLQATYTKLRRRESIDFPILGVAAVIELDDDGFCSASSWVRSPQPRFGSPKPRLPCLANR